jgi:hypothetical protein
MISKILYDKSQKNATHSTQGKVLHTGHQKNLSRSLEKSTIFDLHAWSSPSILPILTPQENSLTQVSTNQKRFYDL